MALKGSTREEQIWNFLKECISNNYGVAGLMGNLDAESNLNPKNLENLCERRLKEAGKLYCTDETYTSAVDSVKISRAEFLNPLPGKQYGYGLAQWTSTGRKAVLYDFVKSKGVSIGDLETQLEFLVKELSTSYNGVLSVLKTANSIRQASDKVLTGFECPADQSEAVKAERARRGQKYYDMFASVKKEENSNMTEAQARQKVVSIMQGWVGLKRSDKSHAPIIDTYNSKKPLPRGYKVTYKDAYCAATVSAAAIKAGFTDIMPVECSCYYLIEQAKKIGIWQENDAYVPKPGDEILYDWDDGADFAKTDNKGAPEHVGIVEGVHKDTITVIEGNIKGIVGRRTIKVNGRYIRGYITPNYKSKASEKISESPVAKPKEEEVKDTQSVHVQLNYRTGELYEVVVDGLRIRTKKASQNPSVLPNAEVIGSPKKGIIVKNQATARVGDQIWMYIGLDAKRREQWICADTGKKAYVV